MHPFSFYVGKMTMLLSTTSLPSIKFSENGIITAPNASTYPALPTLASSWVFELRLSSSTQALTTS